MHCMHMCLSPEFDQWFQAIAREVPQKFHCHDNANAFQAFSIVAAQQVGQHYEVVT